VARRLAGGDIAPRGIPVLTVFQPWATLIAEGLKPWEFRKWPAPAKLVGQRIGIHAAARAVSTKEVRALSIKLHSDRWRETGLVPEERRDRAIELLKRVIVAQTFLPSRSILCIATLGRPIRNEDLAAQLGLPWVNDSDRDEESMWGWPLTDIHRLQPIVPAQGSQGFWRWYGGASIVEAEEREKAERRIS